eukprot:CAMPEP_0119526796 /NCGR_PEP_ID=MMETSP1344-20130328/41343_1 /TAXON_ID=236787 /ORGANISM="Florenciella parvula, Strain CCMP2471" /LENGTH=107 /DNA_ID=CAMNT_0007565869 /DNA_START=35 /DNA_END=355 /DNA_ORIENTATION=-
MHAVAKQKQGLLPQLHLQRIPHTRPTSRRRAAMAVISAHRIRHLESPVTTQGRLDHDSRTQLPTITRSPALGLRRIGYSKASATLTKLPTTMLAIMPSLARHHRHHG